MTTQGVAVKCLVVNTGVQYTPDGEGLDRCQATSRILAYLIADDAFELPSSAKLQELRAYAQTSKAFTIADKREWDEVLDYLGKEDQKKQLSNYKLLIELHNRLGNLYSCSERDVQRYLEEYLAEKNGTITDKTFKKYCSRVRVAFRAIGRKHRMGADDARHTWPVANGQRFDSRNPMTETLQKLLTKDLPKQLHKVNPNSDVSVAAQEAQANIKKYGLPVSVVIVYWSILQHIYYAVDKYTQWLDKTFNHKERIINQCYLALLKAVLMHEGCRPGEELFKILMNDNLQLVLHESVPWLTLVFLNADTLAHLLKNNKIRFYMTSFFKGKKKQEYCSRIKSAVPSMYNTLDMLWVYVVCMKILISLDPTLLGRKVFAKTTKGGDAPNIADIHATANKSQGLEGFKFYSIRYGAAEEDRALRIPGEWTQERMGHAPTSDMRVFYARNKNMRTLAAGQVTSLGTDGSGASSSTSSGTKSMHKDLEFNLATNVTYDSDWLQTTFQDQKQLQDDFLKTNEMVNDYLKSDSEAAKSALLKKMGVLDVDTLGTIPMGTNIRFAEGMLPEKLQEKYTDAVNRLEEVFDKVESSSTLELKYFAQTLYNTWGNSWKGKKSDEEVSEMEEEEEEAVEKMDTEEEEEEAMEKAETEEADEALESEEEDAQEPEVEEAVEKVMSSMAGTSTRSARVVKRPKRLDEDEDEDESKPNKKSKVAGITGLTAGCTVILISPEDDPEVEYKYKVTKDLVQRVWLAQVTRYEASKNKIMARFYRHKKRGTPVLDSPELKGDSLILSTEANSVELIEQSLLYMVPPGQALFVDESVIEQIKDKLGL